MRPMTPASDAEHKAAAPQSVRCFVVTVSDTRTEATDRSGRAIVDLLTAAGHNAVGHTIVKDCLLYTSPSPRDS